MEEWREMLRDDPMTLYHHGILGQKWGVRRYQNKDGSLTEAGRKRYYDDNNKLNEAGKKEAEKQGRSEVKRVSKKQAKIIKDTTKAFTATMKSKEMLDLQKEAMNDPCGQYGRTFQKYIKKCTEKYYEAYDQAYDKHVGKNVVVGTDITDYVKGVARPENPFKQMIFDDDTVKSYESYNKHIKNATIDQVDKKRLFDDFFDPAFDEGKDLIGVTDDDWDDYKFETIKEVMEGNPEMYKDTDWKKYRK